MINKGTITIGIFLGSAIGASLGVLFAPDKGRATRQKLKEEAADIKEQISKDALEVKDDLAKTAASGKESLEKHLGDFKSKVSYKTESVISFLEKQLAVLKEKNKKLQKTI